MISSRKIIPLSYFEQFGPDFLIFKTNIKEPKQYFQVRRQIIWGNKFIKYKGKSLMIENWINSGIIFINDIIDDQGNISEVVILQNLICKQNWMSETSIVKKSIPAEWKQIIKNEESIMTKVNISFLNTSIYLNSQYLNNQTSKNIYKNILNSQNISIPLGFSI